MSLGKKLFSGVLEKEDVSVVEWVSNLESVDNISSLQFHLGVDFLGGQSVLVEAVIEFDFLDESSFASRYQKVSLGQDTFDLGVLAGECSEGSGTDFFLSVFEEDWVFNHSQDIRGEF